MDFPPYGVFSCITLYHSECLQLHLCYLAGSGLDQIYIHMFMYTFSLLKFLQEFSTFRCFAFVVG